MKKLRMLLWGIALVAVTFSGSTEIRAQSQFGDALKQTVNLAPKAKRGDAQTYIIDIETIFLDEKGAPLQIKKDKLAITQLCLANSPDTGVVYQVTVDSLLTGQKLYFEDVPHDLYNVEQYRGKTFKSRITRKVPVTDGCYAIDIEFPEGERYLEALELEEILTVQNLIEQMRYIAGRGLSQIGNTTAIRIPAPMCFSIPEVIVSSETKLSSFNLTMDGYSLVRSNPCAVVAIQPHFAQIEVKLYSTDENNISIKGMMARSGEFRVRLSDGDIVSAKILDRLDAEIATTKDNVQAEPSRSYRTITITQLN